MREGQPCAPGMGHRAEEQCASGTRGHRVGVGTRLLGGPGAARADPHAGPDAAWRRHLAAMPRRGFLSGEGGEGTATAPRAGERGIWAPERMSVASLKG